ncbi:MAG: hypothetical protein M3Z19_14270, partial [Chloroflexota bacterium]|nr:hypothetical protein [Chloroflexota bacterium]
LVTPPVGTFADIAPGTAYYPFVETAFCHAALNGYNCGGNREPCDPQNRPYFRAGNQAIRAQIATIVYGALSNIHQGCVRRAPQGSSSVR